MTRWVGSVAEPSCIRLGSDSAYQMIHISIRECDPHLLKTESGGANVVLEGQITPPHANRRSYGSGMAMCKASLPADLKHSK